MFRTSSGYHQEDQVVHAVLYAMFFMHLCNQSRLLAWTIKPTYVFMQSAEYCCLILNKFRGSRQIFVKVSNIKFCGIPSSGNRVDTCGQTRRFSTLRERVKNPNYTKNDPDSYVTMIGRRMEAAMRNIHLYVTVLYSKYRLYHTFFSVTFASTLTSSCLEDLFLIKGVPRHV
jgi:hypothetical protein